MSQLRQPKYLHMRLLAGRRSIPLVVYLLPILEVLQHRIHQVELCHLIPQVVLQPLTDTVPLRLLTYLVEVHLCHLVVP
jgi:hypothetical protein